MARKQPPHRIDWDMVRELIKLLVILLPLILPPHAK